MDFIRSYYWGMILLAILLVSLIIIMIFIIINVCISKRASQYRMQTKANHYSGSQHKTQDNQVFQKHIENEKPPLPPRDQFQSMESVDDGYEHVEPLPDYLDVQEEVEFPQPLSPQYAKVETKSQGTASIGEDYDDVEMPANTDSEDYDDIA